MVSSLSDAQKAPRSTLEAMLLSSQFLHSRYRRLTMGLLDGTMSMDW